MDRRIGILASESVALLKEMIAIKSPSFEEEKVCSHISGWMSDKGVTHERVGNNIIASHIIDESRPTLMLCAHIDTVSASPDYRFDPYSPDYQKAAEIISAIRGTKYEESDIVAGLGSNDDGASAVAMIAVYRYFIRAVLETCDTYPIKIYSALGGFVTRNLQNRLNLKIRNGIKPISVYHNIIRIRK